MKIAILGGGLSGLACALTLEKHGLYPTIFEKRSEIGDRFVNGEIFLSILNRPITDAFSFFSEEHQIYLHPISNISNLTVYSKHETSTIKGNLGFTTMRGRHKDALEKQMARQVKSDIIYNSIHTYEELVREFTHVIVATGDAAYTEKIQDFQRDLTVSLQGVTVEGSFDVHAVAAWLNYDFAPKGYGYCIPYSNTEANLVLAYPNYPEIMKKNETTLWKNFFETACRDFNQQFRITDHFKVTNYIIGICPYPRIGNTLFTGNCFGAIMPFLGFGQFIGIMSGIYAAYDLCGKKGYDQSSRSLRKTYNNSLIFRRYLEQIDNEKLDTLVRKLDGPLGYRLFNSKHYDPLKIGSYLLRPWIRNFHKKRKNQ